MVIGLTMIKVSLGREKSVYADLQKRAGIRDVYRLFGEYNFFLVMQAEGKMDLGKMLHEIENEESVIETGPILFTAESDHEVRSAAAFG
ncbi:Uncharacterised protein [uncultured archaeon]|nr:Uncharacterised protein [uncultured archaeon]